MIARADRPSGGGGLTTGWKRRASWLLGNRDGGVWVCRLRDEAGVEAVSTELHQRVSTTALDAAVVAGISPRGQRLERRADQRAALCVEVAGQLEPSFTDL